MTCFHPFGPFVRKRSRETALLLTFGFGLVAAQGMAADPVEGPVLPAAGPQPVSVLAEEGAAGQLDERSGSLSDVGASNTDTVPNGREPTMQELLDRIQQLESEHDTLEVEYDTFRGRFSERGDLGQMIRRSASAPVLDERSGSLSGVGVSNTDVLSTGEDSYGLGYDGGFYFNPDDPEKDPYSMKLNGRMQFRYIGFARSQQTWTDSAGTVLPIDNRSDFEIERGRLSFKGFILDPDLQYFINFDFDTDDRDQVIIHDFWVNRKFSDALNVFVGKAFVPGSREWINGSTTTRLVDRTLACTFFRPDRTVGIWAEGEYLENRYYRAMIGDGFNTTGRKTNATEIDGNFVYSGTTWWDVSGNHGRGYSDLEDHDNFAMEIGTSFTYGQQDGPGPFEQPRIEQNFVRLADGTRVTTPDAIFPGVTVDQYDIALWAVDEAWKWRGWSFDMEYYFRQLSNFAGKYNSGPNDGQQAVVPSEVIYNHGFGMEAGYFLIPKRFEVNFRTSQIYGDYGPSREYAGGVNWFVNGTHNYKWSFDATQLYGSAATNSGPNYVAGQTGVLFRMQLQAAF